MSESFLKISGYINPMPEIDDVMTVDEIREVKIDLYPILIADLNLRVGYAKEDTYGIDSVGSPVDSSDWGDIIDGFDEADDKDFRAYVLDKVEALLDTDKLPIKEVEFDEYSEGMTVSGYDYVAVIDIDLNTCYQERKASREG